MLLTKLNGEVNSVKVPGKPVGLVYNLKLFKAYSTIVGFQLPKIKSVLNVVKKVSALDFFGLYIVLHLLLC